MIRKFYKIFKGSVSKLSSALYSPSYYDAPTTNYIAYIQNGTIYIGHSLTAVPRQFTVDRAVSAGTDVSITFKQQFIQGPNRKILNRAVGGLQIFHITNNTLYYRDGIEGSPIMLADDTTHVAAVNGWVDTTYQQFDQGLIVFYSKLDGKIYYRNYLDGAWSIESILTVFEDTVVELNAFRTVDYRIGLYITCQNKKQLILTDRANVASATQDNDNLRITCKSTASILSDKIPDSIIAAYESSKSISILFDAEIVINSASSINDISLYVKDKYRIRPFTRLEVIDKNKIKLISDVDISWVDVSAILEIASGFTKTPAGTTIPYKSVGISIADVPRTPVEVSNITKLYNITEV